MAIGDFAKLVERLEKAGCSFVCVTQSFNTSTSMGRPTLGHCQRKQIKPPFIALPCFGLGTKPMFLVHEPR
jgi:DNA invertase Pin-like site-specific DNA recombinase